MAAESAGLGTFAWDPRNDRILWESERMREIVGRPSEEPLSSKGEFVRDIIHPEDVERFENELSEALKDGRATAIQCRIRRKNDGALRWIELSGVFSSVRPGGNPLVIAMARDITERIDAERARLRAEEALRESEERLRLAQENAGIGVWDWKLATGEVTLTPELSRLYGLAPGAITMYQEWRQLALPEDIDRIEAERDRAIAEHRPFDLEFRVRHGSGEIRWLSAKGGAIYDETGRATRVLGVNVDITERKRTEEALRDSEARFKAIASSTPDHLLVQDSDLRYELVVNPQLGLTEEDMIGKTDFDILTREDAERLTEIKRRVLESGEPVRVESPATSTTGEQEFFEGSYMPRFDAAGRVDGLIGYFRNVTESKRAEMALRTSEATRRGILDAAQESIWLFSPNGIVLMANETALRRFGKTAEELVGRNFTEVLPADLARSRLKSLDEVVEANRPVESEDERAGMRFRHSWYPVRDEKGRVTAVACFSRDITEQKRAEAALRESEERFRVAQELSPYGFTILRPVRDEAGRVADFTWVYENETMARLNGTEPKAVVGRRLLDLLPGHRGSPVLEAYRDVAEHGEPRILEAPYEGEGITALTWFRLAIVRLGEDIAIMAQDITGSRLAEEERQKLLEREQEARREAEAANRAKDEFLAVLSHELRTPLTAVLGWARILQSGRLDSATTARALEVIEQNVKSQTRLIEDLLDVSRIIARKLMLEKTIVDLALVTRTAVESLRVASQEKGVDLECTLDVPSLPFDGDPARLEQVVWNLVSNAIKFTPEGGRIDVGLRIEGRRGILTVKDSGVGIAAEFLPRLFDRFTQEDTSTSREYTGLGLGLAIVRSIVELHGGTIEAASPGKDRGSIFTVIFPLTVVTRSTAPRRAYPALGGEAAPLRDLKVLVVEDDDDVRQLIGEILRLAGATCETARSSAEALETLGRARPDILVSDIGLPGKDGYALMQEIRALEEKQGGPRMPAIALTGYAQVEDESRVRESGYHLHLAKPVEPETLIGAIVSLTRG